MGDPHAIHKLHGDVVNMATEQKPGSGIIGFQPETAEMYFRNIQIKGFDQPVPAEQFLK